MHPVSDDRRERGIALVVTMMVVVILVGLTGALIPLTSMETGISANHRRAAQTLYAAEAALAWAVEDLQRNRSWDPVLAGVRHSSFWVGGTRHELADGTIWNLEHAEAELQRAGAGPFGAGAGLRWRLYAHGPLGEILPRDPSGGVLSVAVWIADDAAEIDDDPLRDSNGAVMLHAAAAGPAPSLRAVQVTLTRTTAGRRSTVTSWALVR